MGIAIELPRGTEPEILHLIFVHLMAAERKKHYLLIAVAILETSVLDLQLPQVKRFTVRAENILKTAHSPNRKYYPTLPAIKTIRELCQQREKNFCRRSKNAGPPTINIINQALNALGLRFGMTDADIEAYKRGEFQLEKE